MEQTGNAILALCLAALVGLGVPAMIYAGLRRGSGLGQIELAKRSFSRAKQPFKPEEDQLAELAKRVEKFKQK